MKLQELLKDIISSEIPNIDISGVSIDSRNVKKGDLFIAVSGNQISGSYFIPDAIAKGAVAILSDQDISNTNTSIPYFKTSNIRQNISLIASRFYSKKPRNVVAVTGTNGKTSIASFVAQVFELLGKKAATIGTLGIISKEYNFDFGTTTPDAITFHKALETLANNNIDSVIFEASSHGLDQYRVDNTNIKAAGFTNISQDHLDYHKDMKSYKTAKKRLFTAILPKDGIAIINADDSTYPFFADNGRKTWSYGRYGKDIKLISHIENKIELELFGKSYTTTSNIVGDFQIMNILCAIGLVIACEEKIEDVIKTIPKLVPPAGRLEFVGTYNNANIYIDYAHTPDALEKAIIALRPYVENKLSVVFGCGGDRDKTKRPLMGAVADNLADIVYVTDDNPRTEDANTIRQEVLQNLSNKCIDVENRQSAIEKAISELNKGDILLIAGKGHETDQIIGTTKHHFSDKEEVLKAIKKLK